MHDESRMGEISMSGLARERGDTVIGSWTSQSVLSFLLYRENPVCRLLFLSAIKLAVRGLGWRNPSGVDVVLICESPVGRPPSPILYVSGARVGRGMAGVWPGRGRN